MIFLAPTLLPPLALFSLLDAERADELLRCFSLVRLALPPVSLTTFNEFFLPLPRWLGTRSPLAPLPVLPPTSLAPPLLATTSAWFAQVELFDNKEDAPTFVALEGIAVTSSPIATVLVIPAAYPLAPADTVVLSLRLGMEFPAPCLNLVEDSGGFWGTPPAAL